VERRLRNQLLTQRGLARPADVVSWLGAVQSQEFEAAKWGLGLRLRDGATNAAVQRAFDAGQILRTHVMRPTWHFVTPADIRWMLELTGPRVIRAMSSYTRRLELDPPLLNRSHAIIERALGAGAYLTRRELAERLRQSGLTLTGIRLALVVMVAELQGVICSGPRRGKEFTYALIAERAPKAARLSRDEALATLSRRYFSSHGPATVRDFVWWSGLTTADAKRALDMNKARRHVAGDVTYWTIGAAPRGATRRDGAHLLPIYDEYLVAHRDRLAVPLGPRAIAAAGGASVTFQHALVIDGQVAGTWRTARSTLGVSVRAIPLWPLAVSERRALAEAVRRYEQFLCVPVHFQGEKPSARRREQRSRNGDA